MKRKAPARRKAARGPSQPQSARAKSLYAYICELALALPGSELSTSYGTPSIKVKGKVMARLRSEAEGGLAMRCDFVDRQMLMQAAPEAFYLTDHYNDYPTVLINLDEVRRDALPDLVERAWRMVAPPKLVAEFERLKTDR